MDHREQMQTEAERLQGKNFKPIQAVRYGVLIFGILGVLVLFLQNLGFPNEVNETLTATVITKDGQTLECTVEIRGEVTHYPLNEDMDGVDNDLTIYANGNYLFDVGYRMAQNPGPLFYDRRP